jgi:hypothetical protein
VRDPVTGLTSTKADSATLTVLGPLLSITLSPGTATRHVGESLSFTAPGHFAGGSGQNQPGGGGRAGTALISATDPETGVSSSASGGDALLTVRP